MYVRTYVRIRTYIRRRIAPACCAVLNGHADVVRQLLSHSAAAEPVGIVPARVHCRRTTLPPETPLIIAGRLHGPASEIFRMLVGAGADGSMLNEAGVTVKCRNCLKLLPCKCFFVSNDVRRHKFS